MKCSPLVNGNNSQESAGIKKKIPADPQSQQTPPAPQPWGSNRPRPCCLITEVGGGEEREALSVMLLHYEYYSLSVLHL